MIYNLGDAQSAGFDMERRFPIDVDHNFYLPEEPLDYSK
jgi:hypothetical protein